MQEMSDIMKETKRIKMNAVQIAAMVFGVLAAFFAIIAEWHPFLGTSYRIVNSYSLKYDVLMLPKTAVLIGMTLVVCAIACVGFGRKSKGTGHILIGLAFLAFWVICKYSLRGQVDDYIFDGYKASYFEILAAAFLMFGAGVLLRVSDRKEMPAWLLILTVFAMQWTAFMTFMPFGSQYYIDGPWGLFTLLGWMRCVILAICLFEAGVLVARDMRKDLLLLLGGVVILAMAFGSFLNEYYYFEDAQPGFYGLVIGGLLLIFAGIVLPGKLTKHSRQPEAVRE